MKKTLLTLILILSLSPAFSQKRQTEKVVLTYMQLPLTPLTDEVKTYETKVTYTGSRITQVFTKDQIEAALMIPGFERAEDGDIFLELLVGEYDIREREIVKANTSSALDPTSPDGSRPTWTYEFTQKIPVKLIVYNREREGLYETFIDNSDAFKPKRLDMKFLDRSSLEAYWSSNSHAALVEMEKNLLQSHLWKLTDLLTNKYGYKEEHINLEIHSFKSKKADYSDFDMAMQAAIKGYQNITLKKGEELVKDELQKAINLWEGALAEYEQGGDRVTDKVAEAALFNCAIACIWMNDFAGAEKYMGKAEAAKKSTPWTAYWKKIMNERKIRYEANLKM